MFQPIELSKRYNSLFNPDFKIQSWGCNDIFDPLNDYFINDFHEIQVFEIGKGWHEINEVKHLIKDFSVHFLPKNSGNKITCADYSVGYRLLYNSTFFDSYSVKWSKLDSFPFLNPFSNISILHFDKPNFENLLRTVEQLKNAYISITNRDNRNEAIQILTHLLFLQCQQAMRASNEWDNLLANTKDAIALKFINLIENSNSPKLKVEECARKLYVSVSTLDRHCKIAFQKTAIEIIHEFIIRKAKGMLLHSDKTIKDIAWHLGFRNDSNFVEFFTKMVGITPNKFKKLKY